MGRLFKEHVSSLRFFIAPNGSRFVCSPWNRDDPFFCFIRRFFIPAFHSLFDPVLIPMGHTSGPCPLLSNAENFGHLSSVGFSAFRDDRDKFGLLVLFGPRALEGKEIRFSGKRINGVKLFG